ncbi:LOW QUALITY PROTEIN: protein dispatched homolog 1-like [Asterias amurensis]|uniref:LOW QUALITY PROTEIN: protein dispatched homolog 1-like n=1 Tax=Asterias amurensis TaxID=7602 RepID=UPI003AB8134D
MTSAHRASMNGDCLRDSHEDARRENLKGGGIDTRPRPGGVCFMYSRFLSRFWYVICLLVFLTVGVLTTLSLTAYELPDFSDPSEGFETRGTVIQSRLISLSNLMEDEDQVVSLPLAVYNSQPRIKRQAGTDAGVQFCYSIEYWGEFVPVMVFEQVEGGNTLTTLAIKSVCTTEEQLVTNHPLFMSNCLCVGNYSDRACPSTWSLGNYIALFSNKSSCADITDDDVTSTMSILERCAPYLHNITRLELSSAAPGSIPAECSQHDFGPHTVLYYLLPAVFTQDILDGVTPLESRINAVFYPIHSQQKDALETIYTENIMPVLYEDGITTVKAVKFFIKFRLFSSSLFADTLYMGIGIGLVFFLIWVYTGSFLVTLTALFNMVFSLVLGYFFFTVVFSRPFFPFGNFMTVILIIGVGADDTFVFMDLWKQSRAKLGIEDLPLLVYETLRHASVTMFVTSATTSAALFATVVSHTTAVKCFAVFAGTSIIMNLVLTLTLLPAVIVMQHRITLCCCRSRKQRSTTTKSKCTICLNNILFKPISVVFERVIPFLVSKLRYLWITLFTLLMICGAYVIFFQPGFQLPSQADFQFFAISHPFEQYDFVYKKEFSFSKEDTYDAKGTVIWGVQAVDNGNHWEPGDSGTLILDDSFQFNETEHQTWMLNFCAELRNQSFVNPDEPVRCFIENFKNYMEMSCTNPRPGEDVSPCCNQFDFPYDPALFDLCLYAFATEDLFPELFFGRNNSRLVVINVTFTTTFPKSDLYSSNDEFWKSVNPWMEEKISSAPDPLHNGWFISEFNYGLQFYDLQQSLASGTQISMVITLAIASGVLLLVIQNVLITICAMVTITSAVFVTVASLVLLGWELNIIEATIVTLAVGLSVDFTIHYGVAFKLSPSSDRDQRTRYSLTTMTAAITIAALSTFIAGAIVLPATVVVYYQFGVFLMLVVSISWSHGTFFFQALCITIGPQGRCGDVPCLPCCECCRVGEKPSNAVKPAPLSTVIHSYDNPPLASHIVTGERVQTISRGLVLAAPREESIFLAQNNRDQANSQNHQAWNDVSERRTSHRNGSANQGHNDSHETQEQRDRYGYLYLNQITLDLTGQ